MSATILLYSGGIDSTAVAAWLEPDLCFTVDYGQVCARAELDASEKLSAYLGLTHQSFKADFSSLACGSLAGKAQIKNAPTSEWWPFRNQLLATIAAIKASQVGASKIILGSVSTDATHADGRDAFYKALSSLIMQQELGIVVEAPALHLTTADLVKKSEIPLTVLPLTYSCHSGNIPCSQCRGCFKRFKVFAELGLEDT